MTRSETLGSAACYAGIIVTLIGVALLVKPLPQVGVATRTDASVIVIIGIALTGAALIVPTSELRVKTRDSQLDQIFPVWQFGERHAIDVDASAAQLMDAVRTVKGSEIRMFRPLTWIRRGGRSAADSILDAANINEPIIAVALRCGFVELANSRDRELVVGTVIASADATRQMEIMNFGSPPTGCIVAGMNFLVSSLAPNRSRLSTETRVNARGARARRAFAVYWRLIYPGSALIRRMWLRAVARRATTHATH